MTWHDLLHDRVTSASSPVESQRFGVSFARVVVGQEAVWSDDLRRDLAASCDREEDVLVVRWPGSLVACAAAVAQSGRDVLVADTLTYWEAPSALVASSGGAALAGLESRELAGVEVEALDRAVTAVFANYVNHYTANPLLDSEAALAGYLDWVRRTRESDGGGTVLLDQGAIVGVATWSVEQERTELEILLAGMVPEARNRGWYGHLLAEAAHVAVGLDVPRIIISTQASNSVVQRAWVRAGLKPFASVTTAHLVRRGLLSPTDAS